MRPLDTNEVLAAIPQQPPMRFVDRVVELNGERVVGEYTWKESDCAGHFPGNPIVPGVKLMECAAQLGIVAWGMYHLSLVMEREELTEHVGLFTRVEEASFKSLVLPGDKIRVTAEFGDEGYFRDNKIVIDIEGVFVGGELDGETVFTGRLAGMAVPRSSLRRVVRGGA